jgi:hypothetical protein
VPDVLIAGLLGSSVKRLVVGNPALAPDYTRKFLDARQSGRAKVFRFHNSSLRWTSAGTSPVCRFDPGPKLVLRTIGRFLADSAD